MLIYKNLYNPPKKIKDKDQYPASTYELDGYTSYSWGENVPKFNQEPDSYISRCWNKYTGTLILKTEGFDSLGYNSKDFKKVDIKRSIITFNGYAGVYKIILTKENDEGEEDLAVTYPVIIYPNHIKVEDLDILNYSEKINMLNKILAQFSSSLEKQVDNNIDVVRYRYVPGISYNYYADHNNS